MTIQEIQKQIINEFKNFDDWMDKYNYLVRLGKNSPPIDLRHKTEENLIKGCQLKTWFHSAFKDGRVYFEVESSSLMISGIAGLLKKILSGQKPEDVKNADLYFIDKIGLKDIFSPIRANSLWKIVNQIKSDAISYEMNALKEEKPHEFKNI